MATITNPIKSTSRDFVSIMNDINSDPDLNARPEWFKRMIAGMGDSINTMLDLANNQTLLGTADSRVVVADKLALIDYFLSSPTTSTGTIFVDLLTSVTFPKTLLLADLISSTVGSVTRPSLRFEARAQSVISQTTEVFTAAVTDLLTVARVYATGELVQVSTAGTLPLPLAVSTDYYAVYVSDTTIKLATTRANAHAGTVIDITTTGTGTHTIDLFTESITMYQQESVPQFTLVEATTEEFQEHDLPDTAILADTVAVEIDSITWTKVTSLKDSISTDTHFLVIYKSDGTSFLRFGNGTFGKVPGVFNILVAYAKGGGTISNVQNVDDINTYLGTDTDVTAVSNPSSITGGDDEEDLINAKKIAPLLLASRDRFVKTSDGEALLLANFSVSKVSILRNEFGPLSAKVLMVPSGGGAVSAQLLTDSQTFLIDRSILESMDVRTFTPTYITVAPTSAFKVLPGFLFANVQPFFELAWSLLISETGQEIKDDFDSNGIESAVTLINNFFTTSFDANDYTQITTMIESLTPADFGEDLQDSSVKGFLDSFVSGVDYVTIAVPSLPLVIASDEITTRGAFTTTEIV